MAALLFPLVSLSVFPCVILHVCLLLYVGLSELVGMALSVQVAARCESSALITLPSPQYEKTGLRLTHRQLERYFC